jgi:hypothetical protein
MVVVLAVDANGFSDTATMLGVSSVLMNAVSAVVVTALDAADGTDIWL